MFASFFRLKFENRGGRTLSENSGAFNRSNYHYETLFDDFRLQYAIS